MTQISVIICTYNPDLELLNKVVCAILPQLSENDAELILVDNNSDPTVSADTIGVGSKQIRLVTEKRQGLAYARARGIKASQSELIVFVDDDNILDPDYIQECLNIARQHRNLGVVAGRSTGDFDCRPSVAIRPHLERYAVRDLGDEMLQLSGELWQRGEPFGAGMMVRKDIAVEFLNLVDRCRTNFPLGRSGTSLASGEDTLFSRLAHKLGYQVGYAPMLHLIHVIPRNRLDLGYFARLLRAQASSNVMIELMCGRPPSKPPSSILWTIVRRFLSRVRDQGIINAFTFIWWDKGELETANEIYLRGIEKFPRI